MPATLFNIGSGTAEPSAGAQFGNKYFHAVEDAIPIVTLASMFDDSLKSYRTGIRAPLKPPIVANSGTDAVNIESTQAEQTVYVAYCFYSKKRVLFSQLSPPRTWKMSVATVDTLTINGFETPRDSQFYQDVDAIVVAVQLAGMTGLRTFLPTMMVDVSDYDFANASFTFDLSSATLEGPGGFDMGEVSLYMAIPPPVKFLDRFGERIWYGGRTRQMTFSSTDITITKSKLTGTVAGSGTTTITGTGTNFDPEIEAGDVIELFNPSTFTYPEFVTIASRTNDTSATASTAMVLASGNYQIYKTWRGVRAAKLVLSGNGYFTAQHLHTSVYVNGRYLGEIFDIHDWRTAYLDRDVDANISATSQFYFVGHNDRLYPSSWVQVGGGIPVAFPEAINLAHAVPLSAVIDDGKTIMGIHATREQLYVVFNDGVTVGGYSGAGDAPGQPLFALRADYGRCGAVSSKSICKGPAGELAWIGEEGIVFANTAGIESIAHQIGCNQLWKGGQWIATTDLENIAMTYSRQQDGYVFGDFTIDGEAGWWGLLTLKPQLGIWLFNGQTMTSNLLEYPDSAGNGVIVVGDAVSGRLKRLLTPGLFTDIPQASDGAGAAYTCEWREGWVSRPDGTAWSPSRVRLTGVVLPGATCTITGTLWSCNFPVRHDDDITA